MEKDESLPLVEADSLLEINSERSKLSRFRLHDSFWVRNMPRRHKERPMKIVNQISPSDISYLTVIPNVIFNAEGFGKAEWTFFDKLIYFAKLGKDAFLSANSLAEAAGCGLTRAKEAMKRMVELGICKVKKKRKGKTTIYVLTDEWKAYALGKSVKNQEDNKPSQKTTTTQSENDHEVIQSNSPQTKSYITTTREEKNSVKADVKQTRQVSVSKPKPKPKPKSIPTKVVYCLKSLLQGNTIPDSAIKVIEDENQKPQRQRRPLDPSDLFAKFLTINLKHYDEMDEEFFVSRLRGFAAREVHFTIKAPQPRYRDNRTGNAPRKSALAEFEEKTKNFLKRYGESSDDFEDYPVIEHNDDDIGGALYDA